ncbi:hypothetical protein GCM10010201_22520 [Pilimelia columellifera subsp. columellifera]|uniref:Activator of Hsp90 ATPase homologue 1/2-like C-terminal domain-containing protein n=1 Tax=Pilimelia columellifera subsp. columellifera TaxID=706583 RepID=A0ABN3NJ12_9ACTN
MAEILIDVDLRHPVERVWRALTDRAVLGDWLMPTDLEPYEGRSFVLCPDGLAGFDGPIDGELVEVAAPRRVVMLWHEEQGRSRVSWELTATEVGCRLTMTQTGFFGVQGTLRRHRLLRAYQLMLNTRLPAALNRLATGTTPPYRPPGRQRTPPSAGAGAGAELAESAQPIGLRPAAPQPAADISEEWSSVELPLPSGADHRRLLPSTLESTASRNLAADPHTSSARQRRAMLLGAAAGALVVLVAVVIGGWLVAPRVLPALGMGPGGGQDGQVGPGAPAEGGLGQAAGPPTVAGATPAPAAATTPDPSPSRGDAPARPGQPGGPPGPGSAPTATRVPPPNPGGQPTIEWIAGYRTVRSDESRVVTEVVVGNPGRVAGSGWRVVVTAPRGAELGQVRGAVGQWRSGQAVFTALDPREAVPAGGSVRFRFTLRGVDAITGCAVGGSSCAGRDLPLDSTRYDWGATHPSTQGGDWFRLRTVRQEKRAEEADVVSIIVVGKQ